MSDPAPRAEGAGYQPVSIRRTLDIRRLCTVHCFEYTPTCRFPGESHDFRELLHVDRGTLEVVAGQAVHLLQPGQILFHAPGEFHALHATGPAAPNLVVISFCCDSPAMAFFRQRICRADKRYADCWAASSRRPQRPFPPL